MKNIVIVNDTYDPWYNLSLEEYLLCKTPDGSAVLYLWQNANTVVIGKNQNPWRECRTELLESEDGKLARRSTGGGAVYHDLGNLNFSFILDREKQNFTEQAKVIVSALEEYGVRAYATGRNDIVTDEGKISGNAFTYRRTRALHHGTLLVDVDKEKLGKYLQVSKEKMMAKGIKSVQSRIRNLKEYNGSITVDDLKDKLIDKFIAQYGEADIYDVRKDKNCLNALLDKEEIDRIYKTYASWEYRYGEAPAFDTEWVTRFPWGGIEIHFSSKNGIITKNAVFSDAMDESFISGLANCFADVKFKKEDMVNALLKKYGDNYMACDIAAYISEKEI